MTWRSECLSVRVGGCRGLGGWGEGEKVGGKEGLQVSMSLKSTVWNDVTLAQAGESLPSVKVHTFFLVASLCAGFIVVLDILCHALHLLASLLGLLLQPLHFILLLLQ